MASECERELRRTKSSSYLQTTLNSFQEFALNKLNNTESACLLDHFNSMKVDLEIIYLEIVGKVREQRPISTSIN